MRKLTMIFILLSVILSGCNSSKTSEIDSEKVKEENQSKKLRTKELKNNTAVLHDLEIKVLNTEYLPMNTYEGQEKPQLVVTYEAKNKVDKEIDPIGAWFTAFEAYQDTSDSMKKIDVGPLPNMEKYNYVLDNQDDLIKKGKSVRCAIAYDIYDVNKPVILKAHKGYDNIYLGEIKVNIKK
ncbi:hypothetical protein AMC75_10730 [Staphylococcus carnosus]|nr:DUF5067 domain-containing protein [Staphylococcus carnosus]KOR12198.1 hypothetical protein AMC75_10730 [Staphylococcus carnosus]